MPKEAPPITNDIFFEYALFMFFGMLVLFCFFFLMAFLFTINPAEDRKYADCMKIFEQTKLPLDTVVSSCKKLSYDKE